jgi:S-adenosylmethionine decarboxylase
MKHSTKGKLVTADIWTKFDLNNWKKLKPICLSALNKSNMHIIKEVKHNFKPQGVTAVWVLAESHMAIHTYPEAGFVAVDVFTCGTEGDPSAVVYELSKNMQAVRYVVKSLERGYDYE